MPPSSSGRVWPGISSHSPASSPTPSRSSAAAARSYILISTTLAASRWVGSYVHARTQYSKLLWACIIINAFMVVASTVVGGYMVEIAQAISASGRLTAVRQFVQQVCTIINGPTAGYLASIAFGWTAAACGGVMFLLVPATMFFLHEQRKRINSRELLDNAGKQLVNIGTAKTMWAAAGLMALFYIAPGFSTAIFYRQQNELHMNTQAQGFLAAHCRNLRSGGGARHTAMPAGA